MSELAAMTVNERLSVTGLLSAWDSAMTRKDRLALIEILGKVELAGQAQNIVDAALRKSNNSQIK